MTGSIITILAPRGGSGKTLLACNLAVVLSAGGDRTVCLVDLDIDSGDVAGSFGLPSPATVTPSASPDGHLVAAMLPELLTPYAPGLDCVLAPTMPGESQKVVAAFVEELLTALQARYDFVVIDTPTRMSSLVQAAIDVSDHHVIVTTPQFPAMRSLRRTLDILDLLGTRNTRRTIVLNHADAVGGLSETQVSRFVRAKVAGRIPTSRDAFSSINAHTPLAVSDPQHAVVDAISDFAKAHLMPTYDTSLIPSARPANPI